MCVAIITNLSAGSFTEHQCTQWDKFFKISYGNEGSLRYLTMWAELAVDWGRLRHCYIVFGVKNASSLVREHVNFQTSTVQQNMERVREGGSPNSGNSLMVWSFKLELKMFSLFEMLISEPVHRVRCATSHANLIRRRCLY